MKCWAADCDEETEAGSMYCFGHTTGGEADKLVDERFGPARKCRKCGTLFRDKSPRQVLCVKHRVFG